MLKSNIKKILKANMEKYKKIKKEENINKAKLRRRKCKSLK